MSSGKQEATQTSGYPHQSAVEANLKTDMEIYEEMIKRNDKESDPLQRICSIQGS